MEETAAEEAEAGVLDISRRNVSFLYFGAHAPPGCKMLQTSYKQYEDAASAENMFVSFCSFGFYFVENILNVTFRDLDSAVTHPSTLCNPAGASGDAEAL